MINYKNIETYCRILHGRKIKLEKAWCSSSDDAYKLKCTRLSIRLEKMIDALRDIYWTNKKEDEEYQLKLDNEMVLLSCHRIECDIAIGMTRVEYAKSNYDVICEKCGREMITDKDRELREMLCQSGIYTKQ